jgi:hypothetical protein
MRMEALRIREKAHTKEGDAIAGGRRRLPVVEVDGGITVIGAHDRQPAHHKRCSAAAMSSHG